MGTGVGVKLTGVQTLSDGGGIHQVPWADGTHNVLIQCPQFDPSFHPESWGYSWGFLNSGMLKTHETTYNKWNYPY